MTLLKSFHHLSWKQILTLNFSLFILGSIAITQIILSQPTRTHSKADQPLPPAITTLSSPQYPLNPPSITSLKHFFGKPGDIVRIQGQNFGTHQWDSQLMLDHTPILTPQIINWSDTTIDFLIPQNAQSASLLLTVNQKIVQSPYPLIVFHHHQDPHLTFDSQSQTLTIKNLPSPATLTLNLQQPPTNLKLLTPASQSTPTTITWQLPSSSPAVNLLSASDITLQSAQLTTANNLLPLYIDPLSTPQLF